MEDLINLLPEEFKEAYAQLLLKRKEVDEAYLNFKKSFQSVKARVRRIEKEMMTIGESDDKFEEYTIRNINNNIESIKKKYVPVEKHLRYYKEQEKDNKSSFKTILKYGIHNIKNSIDRIANTCNRQLGELRSAESELNISQRYFKNINSSFAHRRDMAQFEVQRKLQVIKAAEAEEAKKELIVRIPWMERTFTFGWPEGMFPNLLERLRATAPHIDSMTHLLDDELLKYKPRDKWSIKEHIGHLADLEHLHIGRLEDFMNNLPELRPADMTNAATNNHHHNYSSVSRNIHTFLAARNVFIRRILEMDREKLNRKAMHPRLKQLITPVDMLFFIAEHDLHHITTIREIINSEK